MAKIAVGTLPKHGILLIEVPAGMPWRAVQGPDRQTLPGQFVPAAYGNGQTAGRLMVRIPQGVKEVTLIGGEDPAAQPGSGFITLGQEDMTLTLGPTQVTLTDRLDTHEWDGSWAMEAVAGIYPLVSGQSRAAVVSDGPLAQVVRISTPLVSAEDGKALGATSHYDLYQYKDLPLAAATLCFETEGPLASGGIHFFEMKLPNQGFTHWEGGSPLYEGSLEDATHYIPYEVEGFRPRSFRNYVEIDGPGRGLGFAGGVPILEADEETVRLISNDNLGNMDLRALDAGHPLSAFVIYGDGPVDGAAWAGQLPQVMRIQEDLTDALTLRSGALTAYFRPTPGGMDLAALTDNGSRLLKSGGNELFRVVLRRVGTDEQFGLRSLSGWRTVTATPGKDTLTLIFSEPEDDRLRGLSVLLTALCDPEHDRIRWEMMVRNLSPEMSVILADYPAPAYDGQGDPAVFAPKACGEVHEHIAESSLHMAMAYPTFDGAMQFGAVWDGKTRRGLYFGAHDGEGCYKMFTFERSLATGRCTLGFSVPAANLDAPENSFMLPGQAVWQLFSGDWYDAAAIYREWALGHAFWIPPMTDSGRPDMARWLVENPFWFQDAVDENGKWVTDALEALSDLGVPAAYHVYHWHQIPFDNDYPHYNPAKEEFLRGLPILQAAGIKVMPYINGRLWDTHDKGNTDWQFTRVAKPFATKNRHGDVITETYVSREEDGERVKLAVMCPSTALWQEKQREINDWLFNTLGVNAVYLDQIAAADPKLCMDKTHSHWPGGGAWWNYAYYNLLDHLKRIRPADGAFTTECNAEVYMRCIDAYLSWHWTRANQVPAFPAVYAGYCPMFGRGYGMARQGDALAFRILASQSLLFGEQIGWVSPREYLDSPYRALFKQIVRARYAWGEYFYAGQMLRPPVLEDVSELTTLNIAFGYEVINTPVVRGALWQRRQDGARILILINIGDDPLSVTGSADLAGVRTARLTGDLEGELRFNGGRFSLTLPAVSVVVAQIEE